MKNKSVIIIGALAVGVGLTIGYAFWGNDTIKKPGAVTSDVPSGMHRMPDGSLMSNGPANNMGMMDHGSMMVKSEREFLEEMIPHHQEAVDTANEVIARGGSTPEIKKLAQDIIEAQEKEITMMKLWYQDWYGEAYVAKPENYQPMMRDLSALSGESLDAVFLEDMIMHHMGAVMMAESVQPYIEHQEITILTQAIVETQTVEIQLMKRLLGEL